MIADIIKSLAEHDAGIALILLGVIREARLWHKQWLEYKLQKKNGE